MDINFNDIMDLLGLDDLADFLGKPIQRPLTSDDDVYSEILKGVGAPVTNRNMMLMYAWRQAEGGEAANNPFNTTKPTTNSTFYNCLSRGGGKCRIGVRNYSNRLEGILATIQTLKNGKYNNVISALKDNSKSLYDVAKEIKNSKWGTSKVILDVVDGYMDGAKPKPRPISPNAKKIVV